MDIDEINAHIHKLKCGSTDWQSVEKLAALCTVRNELEEKNAPDQQTVQLPVIPAYSTEAAPQSEFVEVASSIPFSELMRILDQHMEAIQLVYPKEYELVMSKMKKV